MRSVLSYMAALASMLFVVGVLAGCVSAQAGGQPTDIQPSGFTLNQEVEIAMVASGTGALGYCATHFKQPKFMVTANTLAQDVMTPVFAGDPENRKALYFATLRLMQLAYTAGEFLRFTWVDSAQTFRPTTLAMDSVETCQALDDMLRRVVTREGSPFDYGTEFKEHVDSTL